MWGVSFSCVCFVVVVVLVLFVVFVLVVDPRTSCRYVGKDVQDVEILQPGGGWYLFCDGWESIVGVCVGVC